jgi:hypothetical protein
MTKWFAIAAGLLLALTTTGFSQKPVVGICPFWDDTGTPAGERSGTMLPVMFLEKAKAAGINAVILNPGPAWSPDDLDWPAELARTAGADVVLVGRVTALATKEGKKATERTLRGHILLDSHAANLVLDATLVEGASGRSLATMHTSELVKGMWLEEMLLPHAAEPFWFANSHFGQAINRSAEQLIHDLGPHLSEVKPSGNYRVTPAGPSCRVKVRVLYKAMNRASKMYLIAVNGKEESLGINDGVVEVEEPSGPILLHVEVKDHPYRQLVQNDYYANSMLDCSRPDNSLAFEIGSAGEGMIRWQ